ncbi:DUF4139 domain-containing protein [Streptomyces sp. NPDC005820]|uniref:DUF4139 domain-containing protein n=1 Tax=Streptomyces sp. NPDC005820 TaxID=3157069 RepID=UPI0033D2E4BA
MTTSESAQGWESSLDSVVVYAQGAVCRRLARGVVPPDGRVRVTGLPRSLDVASLRARVLGGSAVRVGEARVEVDAEPLGTGEPEGLRHEVERLREESAAARARRDRQLALIAEVGALRPVPPARRKDDPHRRTPVDAWLRLADFVDVRLTALHARLVEQEEALRHVEHELSLAEDRLARAATDAPPAHVQTTVSAVLTLDGGGKAEVEVEVEVEYGVPGAVWVPAYRLSHRQDEDSGQMVLRASVAQRTGEDWTGVRIALATADLYRRTDLPRLRSIRIGRRQPGPEPSGWREPPAGLADLFAGYDAAGRRPEPTAAPVSVGATGPLPSPPPPQSYGASVPTTPPGYGVPAPGPVPGPVPAPAFPPGGVYPEVLGGDLDGVVPPVPPAAGSRPRAGGRPAAAPAGLAPPSPALALAAQAPRALTPSAPGGAVPFAPAGPAAPLGKAAPVQPSPAAGPPQPSGAELDYTALVLCGPDEQGGRRGLLFPDAPFDPVAAEYRRRADAVAALPLPGHCVRPRESAGSFDHRFDAVARADIPSDGAWHTVTVDEIPLGLRVEHLCVPSVEQTVYATLIVSNATDRALLAGPVEVTVGDDFLVTAALPTLAPGGVCRVGLGPAEGVRVTRRTNLRESTAGMRNQTTVLDHRVHVELANRLAGPVTVEVRERVPVTSDADVRVEERADWTAPRDGTGPDHHAPGTRLWRVELPAGGTTALEGGYEIRIPSGKSLAGGNRRS